MSTSRIKREPTGAVIILFPREPNEVHIGAQRCVVSQSLKQRGHNPPLSALAKPKLLMLRTPTIFLGNKIQCTIENGSESRVKAPTDEDEASEALAPIFEIKIVCYWV